MLAQQPKQDELNEQKWRAELDQKIAKATTDTARVRLLLKKGQSLFDVNYDSAIFYTERAATLAKRINFLPGQAKVQLALASFYSFKGKDAQAKASFREIQKLLAVSPSVNTASEFYYLYGTFYFLRGQHDSAIIYFKKTIPLVRQLHDGFAAFTEFGTFNNLALARFSRFGWPIRPPGHRV